MIRRNTVASAKPAFRNGFTRIYRQQSVLQTSENRPEENVGWRLSLLNHRI
ncbi:MAG TPA: hypothetical protein VGC86_16055 [Afipia sp.]